MCVCARVINLPFQLICPPEYMPIHQLQLGLNHALRSVLSKWVQKLRGRRGSSREAIARKSLAAGSCILAPVAVGMSQRACGEYVVQRGDTVVRIAEAYGTLTSNVVTQERPMSTPAKRWYRHDKQARDNGNLDLNKTFVLRRQHKLTKSL